MKTISEKEKILIFDNIAMVLSAHYEHPCSLNIPRQEETVLADIASVMLGTKKFEEVFQIEEYKSKVV